MDILLILFFFLLGLIFGSFFNVVGLRLPENIPFANDRSICPHCKRQLSWYENIPFISFVIQGAKCRHCKKMISFMYPVIELSTGILFALSYSLIGLNLEIITALLLVSMLMIILVSDITYMLIPNRVLLFFMPFFIIIRIIQPLDPWWLSILGGIIGITLIALIIIVSRGGMGAGDMKLFGILGIVLGVDKVLLAFFLSCMIGAIIGMMLLLFSVIERKQPVPFGPYIVAATLITYFYGELLLNWYFNLFL
ncbi:prepilin peptidase [Virgibacillus litoralis]|uniref:Leader peptidase (Prepilin peptidase)/N-methyltransferase n=1 Tax=Virgibacillus litoralis TaxID=578221 RepID=A0ABS4HA48_9BACI|nr:A24 family peptidase [Virgibacillus litoralis]MBP1947784.1 leader peptidase (prepilin peptidase)/N-methyltransferase [Virgibacillus litoralis]